MAFENRAREKITVKKPLSYGDLKRPSANIASFKLTEIHLKDAATTVNKIDLLLNIFSILPFRVQTLTCHHFLLRRLLSFGWRRSIVLDDAWFPFVDSQTNKKRFSEKSKLLFTKQFKSVIMEAMLH